jgi:hypothetical protein
VPLEDVTIAPPEQRFVLGNGAGHRCLARHGNSTRMHPCMPEVHIQSWVLEPNGLIRSALTNLCLEASDDERKVYVLQCNAGNQRQRWHRDGNKLKVRLGSASYCVSPRSNDPFRTDQTLRWGACEGIRAQEWFAYRPVENKVPAGGLATIDPDSAEFGAGLAPTLCLASGFSRDFPAYNGSSAMLQSCDRYNEHMLWAQDARGGLRSFAGFSLYLEQPANGALVRVTASGGNYFRNEVGDGTFMLASQQDSERVLFPRSAAAGASIVFDRLPLDANGAPVDRAFWR